VNDPNAAIELTLNRAERLFVGGAGATLQILRNADRILSRRLQRLAAKHGGPTGSYTEAHAQLYRDQIRLTTAYLVQRMAGRTDAQARIAVRLAVKQTIGLATKLETHFVGITRPLALHSQAVQDATLRGAGASRIRQNLASWERYGAAMTRDFEGVLRAGQLTGATHSQMIDHLVSAGAKGGVTAESLHAQLPGSFPEPTGYVRRRYWAERIVRTETAHAYNGAALDTMYAARTSDFPDLQKKIVATFDRRTAYDSKVVHGQIRPLDGYFTDGVGRTYQYPPGRPNDRETIIPWRPHWAEVKVTEPPSPEEIQRTKEAEAQEALPKELAKQRLAGAVAEQKARIAARRAAAKLARDFEK